MHGGGQLKSRRRFGEKGDHQDRGSVIRSRPMSYMFPSQKYLRRSRTICTHRPFYDGQEGAASLQRRGVHGNGPRLSTLRRCMIESRFGLDWL